MEQTLLVILAALIGAVSSRSVSLSQHVHCSKTTCPTYEVIASYGDLELRCYNRPSIWVSISGSGKLYGKPHDMPLWKLIQFLNGNNSKKIDVPIGSISTQLFDESRGVYTTEFFVPFDFRKSMPRPMDKDVRVIYRRSFCTYVYGFYGWLVNYQIIPSYRTKTQSLIAQKTGTADFYPDFFFYVKYRSSARYVPQYNEIWYIRKFAEEEQEEEEEKDVNRDMSSNKTD